MHYWFKSYSDFAEWLDFPIGQSGEASWWRVFYQRGLPRLVVEQPGYTGSVKHKKQAAYISCGNGQLPQNASITKCG